MAFCEVNVRDVPQLFIILIDWIDVNSCRWCSDDILEIFSRAFPCQEEFIWWQRLWLETMFFIENPPCFLTLSQNSNNEEGTQMNNIPSRKIQFSIRWILKRENLSVGKFCGKLFLWHDIGNSWYESDLRLADASWGFQQSFHFYWCLLSRFSYSHKSFRDSNRVFLANRQNLFSYENVALA